MQQQSSWAIDYVRDQQEEGRTEVIVQPDKSKWQGWGRHGPPDAAGLQTPSYPNITLLGELMDSAIQQCLENPTLIVNKQTAPNRGRTGKQTCFCGMRAAFLWKVFLCCFRNVLLPMI